MSHISVVEKDYQMDLQKDYWISLIDRVEKNLVKLLPDLKRNDRDGVPVFEAPAQGKTFILHHPLADFDGPQFINIFDAIRRVSLVMNQLQ